MIIEQALLSFHHSLRAPFPIPAPQTDHQSLHPKIVDLPTGTPDKIKLDAACIFTILSHAHGWGALVYDLDVECNINRCLCPLACFTLSPVSCHLNSPSGSLLCTNATEDG